MTSKLTLSDEFPQDDAVAYLNHAAVGPWPCRTRNAVCDFAEENMRRGAADYLRWMEQERLLREQLRTLINARSSEDIALLKNTSEALSVVAHGLPWKAGDNVITARQEFPSNRIVWESLAARGVDVRVANLDEGDAPEDALLALADENTRLLAVSSVQYGTGLRMDLKRLGEFCGQHGILFCVDAIQSIGAHRFDVRDIGADFVVADGHKWMLGPEGVALFYARAELRERLQLFQYGWHMIEDHSNYDRLDWQVASSARRFECGSPNMLGIHALSASLSVLLDFGMERVETELFKKVSYLIDKLSNNTQLELITPDEPARRAGIVTFRHQTIDAQQLYRACMQEGIICAHRGGGVRFSPHFYTTEANLDRAVAFVVALPRS